jgi:hypothetical protein
VKTIVRDYTEQESNEREANECSNGMLPEKIARNPLESKLVLSGNGYALSLCCTEIPH